MREILFRGKRLDNGEWVEGYLGQDTLIGNNKTWLGYVIKSIPQKLWDCDWFEIDPATIGQYTGLKDKNGKRIFEGDVVQFQRVNALGWITQRVGEVLFPFDDETPCFYVYAPTGDAWDFYTIENIVVIGNTHDNPELLKDGATHEA